MAETTLFPDTEFEKAADEVAGVMRLLSNKRRLMILCQLLDGEKSVSELALLLGTRHSTISQHLALLRKDRLVATRREAQSNYYSLAGEEARSILDALYRLYCEPGTKRRSAHKARGSRRKGG